MTVVYWTDGHREWTTEYDPARGHSLDASDPAVFERWCLAGPHDTRTLDEFVADGGRPIPTNPNRTLSR